MLTFGLGTSTKANVIEIHWPSNTATRLTKVRADQILTIREDSGIINAEPFHKRARAPPFDLNNLIHPASTCWCPDPHTNCETVVSACLRHLY